MGVGALHSESDKMGILSARGGDTQVKCCSNLGPNHGFRPAAIHWRSDNMFREVAETSEAVLASVLHRLRRHSRWHADR